jgi:hypothetical protein
MKVVCAVAKVRVPHLTLGSRGAFIGEGSARRRRKSRH